MLKKCKSYMEFVFVDNMISICPCILQNLLMYSIFEYVYIYIYYMVYMDYNLLKSLPKALVPALQM